MRSKTRTTRKPTVYAFDPVGLDVLDRRTPKNGTMGHTYVADAGTGALYRLMLLASLTREAR